MVDHTAKLNAMNKTLLEKGKKRAAILNELQKDRKEKALTCSFPRELHMQLVHRYGTNYAQDSTLMNDLKRQNPEMFAMNGDTPPPRWGTKAKYRRVGGVWYTRQEDGSYVAGEPPPSKMNWGTDAPPALIV